MQWCGINRLGEGGDVGKTWFVTFANFYMLNTSGYSLFQATDMESLNMELEKHTQ